MARGAPEWGLLATTIVADGASPDRRWRQFDESEPADRVDADGQLDDTDDEPGP
jgi:hypothetical protein